MTAKKKNVVSLIVVLLIGFFVFNLAFPQAINKGLSFFKTKAVPLLRNIPLFPERGFRWGLDLQGGSRLTYQADVSQIEEGNVEEAMGGLRDVIERRVNLFGVGEPVVAVQEAGQSQRLLVELPGVHDIEKAIEMIGKTPFLEFKEEREEAERDKILEKQQQFAGKTMEEIKEIEGWEIAAEDAYFVPTGLTGQYLKRAAVSLGENTFEPEVVIEFNDEGSELFREITERNIGKRLAIYIDDSLISAPVVNEAIGGGKARISGSFNVEEARELARNLNAGALPVPIKLISQTTVGPTLGKISLEKSLAAAVFGFFLVALFMVIFYRLGGLLASVSLLIYVGIILSLFKFIPVTMTLAGIGGAILSVGMAVDANVLIFERFKEERAKGESFQKSLETGFSRAWPSIRDSNATTLIVGLIMFSFGTSFVKGFAVALSLGVLVSMFSVLFVTRIFMRAFAGSKLEKINWLWQ